MVNLKHIVLVEKPIQKADTQYIAHQCNCVSRGVSGIAQSLFDRYPSASYRNNERGACLLGTISVHTDKQPHLINMYAQYVPGKPRGPRDTYDRRYQWFRQCLWHIAQLQPESIGFPWGIGCGFAGGNWSEYAQLIDRFAGYIAGEVKLYRLLRYAHKG